MISGIFNDIQNNLNETIIGTSQINIGYVNDVFFIQTNYDKYILKCFNIIDQPKIDLSIALQKYLSTKNLSPDIVYEGIYGSHYILQRYVDNEIMSNDLFLFGKTLGLIHYNFRTYDDSNIKDFSFSENSLENKKSLSKECYELILLKNNIKHMVHCPQLEQKQLIHGDYTWNNILKKKNEYQVIDFDEAKKYYAIYDVSKVVFDLIFTQKNAWEDINKFLYGYQNICHISKQEKKEFLNIYAYTLMNDCSILYDNLNKDNHFVQKRINRHKDIIRCFDEYDEIRRRIYL